MSAAGGPPEPWERFADAVLQREAAVCRIGLGLPVRDFAGMYVDHEDVDRILNTLPGLDGADHAPAGEVFETLTPTVEKTRADLHDSMGGAGRMAGAARNAGLSAEDVEVLALLSAVDLDPGRQRLVSYIQDSVQLPRLTVSTVMRLFKPSHPGHLALSPGSRLDRSGLVELTGDGPWATRMATVAERFVWHLAGDDSPDPDLPFDHETFATDTADGTTSLLLVPGEDRTARIATASRNVRGSRFLVVPGLEDGTQWRAAVREATITSRSLILDWESGLRPIDRHWIQRAVHLPMALCTPTELPIETLPRRSWVEVRPDPASASGSDNPFGDSHRLDAEQVRLASLAYQGDPAAAVRRLASGHLNDLAIRVQPRRGWDDLVLPADQRNQLRELTARYRSRDRVFDEWSFDAIPSAGIVAVFAGPSGTGKTLAAEVVAGALGLDMYKIDLSAVVSKYIGETEKNLERIFRAASAGNVVLFFDEADALFGKRSEVGDAHDRYANIEVSYLLQRLETYDGLVILATNLQRNMDQAFLRRIHVAATFPLPDEEARRQIWRLSLSREAPLADDIDIDFLARQFDIPGGAIRNAAMTGAFLAADGGVPIAMEHLIRGLFREFQKLGRLQTAADFDRYYDLIDDDVAAAVG